MPDAKHLIAAITVAVMPVFAGTGETMQALQKTAETALCRELRPQAKNCRVVFESVTHNAFSGGDGLWAFSYAISGEGATTAKEAAQFKSAIAKIGSQPLEIEKNRIAAIAYYRGSANELKGVSGEEFHRLALNPTSGIVARFEPAFILSGNSIRYTPPDDWQKGGLASGTNGSLVLNILTKSDAELSAELQTLDDTAHKTVHIVACRSATTACDAGKIRLSAGKAETISLDVKAGRNLKTDQPAFKLVLRLAGQTTPVMQLAIPFKPRPNYFLFGVTGFLFGGLIAVMVMIGRRKPAAQ